MCWLRSSLKAFSFSLFLFLSYEFLLHQTFSIKARIKWDAQIKQTIHCWAIVVVQLAERLLPIPETHSLNPVIGKFLYWTHLLLTVEKTKIKKQAGDGPFTKTLLSTSKMRCTNKKTIHCWAVVLAQLAEQSLVTLEAYGLNRYISKIYCTCIFNLLKGNN